MEVLDEYRKAFDALTTSKNYVIGKKGQGIRKYKQLKRYAYKIGNGQHKSLIINVARFMNEMVNEAHKGKQIVYEDRTDKRLIDLLTKRFNPKKSRSNIQQPQHVIGNAKTSIFRQIKSDRWNALLHNSRIFDETIDSFDWRTLCM